MSARVSTKPTTAVIPIVASTISRMRSSFSRRNEGLRRRSSGGYPVTASSGNATRSAPNARASSIRSMIRRVLPERSPTVLFIWASARRKRRTAHLERGLSANHSKSVDGSDYRDHTALNAESIRVDIDGVHRRVCRLQPNTLALAVDAFQRRLTVQGIAIDNQRDRDLAVVHRVLRLHDHHVAVVDVVVDHRLSLDPKSITALVHESLRYFHHVRPIGDGFDRLARRDESQHPDRRRTAVRQLDPPREVPRAPEVAVALESAQVVIDDGCGADAHREPDLADGRRPPVLGHVLPYEFEHPLLPIAQCAHRGSRFE